MELRGGMPRGGTPHHSTACPSHLDEPLRGLLWAPAMAPHLVPDGRSHPVCRLEVLLVGREWHVSACCSSPEPADGTDSRTAPAGTERCVPSPRTGGLRIRTQIEAPTLRTPWVWMLPSSLERCRSGLPGPCPTSPYCLGPPCDQPHF